MGEAWATSSRNIAYSEFGDHQDSALFPTHLHALQITCQQCDTVLPRSNEQRSTLAGCTHAERVG